MGHKLIKVSKTVLPGTTALLAFLLIVPGCCRPCSPESSIAVVPARMSAETPQKEAESLENRLLKQLKESGVTSLDAVKMNLSEESRDPRAMAAPTRTGAITVGAIFLALQNILTDVDAVLKNAGGEIKSIGAQLQANLQGVITDFDDMLNDKLEKAVDALKDTEKRFVEDVQSLIGQAERFVKLTTDNLHELAYITAAEADILAYNAMYAIPCRNHIPRVVYTSPRKLQLEKHKKEYYFKVRGNYLSYGKPEINLEGKPLDLITRTVNEIEVRIPAELFTDVTGEKIFKINCLLYKCKATGGAGISRMESEQFVSFMVFPPVEYSINVKMVPKIKLPTKQKFTFPYYKKDNNCKANYSEDKNWCLPSEWEVVDFDYAVTDATCGSRINSVRNSGKRCVIVDAQLQGCGPTLFGCPDKRKGRLGYKLFVNGKKYDWNALPTDTQEFSGDNPDQRTFSFTYAHPIPTDNEGINWLYDVKLTIRKGDRTIPILLNETNPNHEGVVTRMSDEGRLIIELDESVHLMQ